MTGVGKKIRDTIPNIKGYEIVYLADKTERLKRKVVYNPKSQNANECRGKGKHIG